MAPRTLPWMIDTLSWSYPQPSISTSSPGRAYEGNTQANCVFLTKLPLDLRLMIYKQVIISWGWSDRLHIENPCNRWEEVLTPEKLRCRSCRSSVNQLPNTPYHRSFCNGRPSPTRFSFWDQHQHCYNPRNQQRSLALLFSCRSIYFEAIGLIYSSFSFDLVELAAAYRFLSLVPQQQLNQIRSLHIAEVEIPRKYLFGKKVKIPGPNLFEKIFERKKDPWPTTEELWLRVCLVLKTMPELDMLQITLLNYYTPMPELDGERALLKSIDGIRVPQGTFIIQVPSTWKTNENDIPGAEFSIGRRDPALDGPCLTREEYRARNPGRLRMGVLITIGCSKFILATILFVLWSPFRLAGMNPPAPFIRVMEKLLPRISC